MTVLEDIAQEIVDYPLNELTLQLVSINPEGSGNSVDQGEDVEFRISVHNDGPLHVRDLSLRVEAASGAEVKSNYTNAPWGQSFHTTAGFFPTIPAHQADGSSIVSGLGTFHFKSNVASTSPRDLVEIYVTGWETDFDHMFSSHTRDLDEPIFVYRSSVGDD